MGGFGQQQQFQLGKSAAAKNNVDDDDEGEEAAEKKAQELKAKVSIRKIILIERYSC